MSDQLKTGVKLDRDLNSYVRFKMRPHGLEIARRFWSSVYLEFPNALMAVDTPDTECRSAISTLMMVFGGEHMIPARAIPIYDLIIEPPTLPVAEDELIVEGQSAWRPIESAPRDGSEILTWREDTGVLLLRWASAAEFMTQAEQELELLDEDEATEPGWFCADFARGCRLDGVDIPTHWRPMPLGPGEAC